MFEVLSIDSDLNIAAVKGRSSNTVRAKNTGMFTFLKQLRFTDPSQLKKGTLYHTEMASPNEIIPNYNYRRQHK